jgi:hypothetical protein
VRSARFRMASRVFATLLLAWTTADLCGHGMCVHDREPLVANAPAAPGHPNTISAADGGQADAAAGNGPDDCFCCCRCVDVQVRFQVPVVCTVVSELFFERPSFSHLPPSPLYHPPLA